MLRRKHLISQAVRFFWSSAIGLGIDVLGFWLMVTLGLEPFYANLISASASITVVYLLVARFAFATNASWMSYAAFFGWYTVWILTFSALISFFAYASGGSPFWWKAISIPISFSLNFAFSRFLFNKFRGRVNS